jgi:integrase
VSGAIHENSRRNDDAIRKNENDADRSMSDAATALRVSEILGLMWMNLNFDDLVMHVRRAYVVGTVQGAEIKGIMIILGGALGGRKSAKSYKSFAMMVARDGIEPPTPAFSVLQ